MQLDTSITQWGDRFLIGSKLLKNRQTGDP
jgi:hypothetical protein